MPDIRILTEAELRQCVRLDKQAVDITEQAFTQLEKGVVTMPPVLSMAMPSVNGEVDVKTAYIQGLNTFTIKASPGFFDNPARGLPSLGGLMVVFCAQTGVVKAVLLDNGYLTDVRTAAAGGVAARHFAPSQVQTAGIIGAGVQAALQAQALLLERRIERLLVWSPTRTNAERYAQRQQDILGIPVTVEENAESVVRQSQLVVTTTPAGEPLIQADWLHPGLHITAMGADSPDKNELQAEVLIRADRFFCDRVQQSLERGELRSAVAAGLISADTPVDELGQVCSGQLAGRRDDQEITVCDLTGTGVQDTAIADHALGVAIRSGLGSVIKA